MSVGKNAINRVKNNGYSSVQTSAPDMENSTVLANPAQEVVEKLIQPIEEKAKQTAVKKTPATKKSPAKTTAKKTTVTKACEKKIAKVDGFKRVSFGQELPYYLL